MTRIESLVSQWAVGLAVQISAHDRAALIALIDAEVAKSVSHAHRVERDVVLRLLGMADLTADPSDDRLRMMCDAMSASAATGRAT